jgi:predicted PurR-regulated permease PerM
MALRSGWVGLVVCGTMEEPAGRGDPPAPTDPGGTERAEPPAGGEPGPPVPAEAEPPPFLERRSTGDGRRIRPPTARVALVLFAAIVVAFALYLGREALSPFVVGLLLVYLLDPPVERLARLGLPRWIAILIVYALAVVIVIEALSLTLSPLVQQITQVITDLPTLAGQLDAQLQRLSEFYRGLDLPPQLRDAIDSWLEDLAAGGAGIDIGVLMPVVDVTAGLVSSIFGYLIIPVWAFYLIKDRQSLTQAFNRSLPAEWRADVWAVVGIAERVFGQWVRGQIFLGLTVGFFTFAGLLVLAQLINPVFATYALLLAIIAGLFELLPIIGPILAAIPAVLIAATAGPEAAIAALVLYTLVQQVENNLLVPKIQGDAVELHPSAVMFALVIGAAIAGLLGAILALPITATGRDIYRYLFRRLGGDAPPTVVVTTDA